LFLLGEVVSNAFCRSKTPTPPGSGGVDINVGLDAKSLAVRNLTAGGLLVVLATLLFLSLIWAQLKQTAIDTTPAVGANQNGAQVCDAGTPPAHSANPPAKIDKGQHETSITQAYSAEWNPQDCDNAMADLNRLVYSTNPDATRGDDERLKKFQATVKECQEKTLPRMIKGLRELQQKEAAGGGRTDATRTVINNLEAMQAYLEEVVTRGNVATLLDEEPRSRLRTWIDSLSQLKVVAPQSSLEVRPASDAENRAEPETTFETREHSPQ
jgi:hypothetical protein